MRADNPRLETTGALSALRQALSRPALGMQPPATSRWTTHADSISVLELRRTHR